MFSDLKAIRKELEMVHREVENLKTLREDVEELKIWKKKIDEELHPKYFGGKKNGIE